MTKNYFIQILLSIDQFANTLLGGWADETLSSRSYRQRNKNKFWRFIQRIADFLFYWKDGPGHCAKAYDSEKQRLQVAPELR